MIRRPCSLPAPRLGAVMFATLWLSGCAATQQGGLKSAADPDRAADLNVAMGIEYMEQGNLPRAQRKLERALAIDPGNADALQANALLYQRQGENRLAREFFKRALAANPDLTRARNNYAAFLYRQGEIAAACEQLERASQDINYDNRAQLFTNLGRCRLERGALADAAESLQRAQSIDPRYAPSYLALARTLTAQGEQDRAWDQLQRFIRLTGTTPESLRLAEQIASARGDSASAAFYSQQLNESQRAP